MKTEKYNRKDIRSLKELRYEKARVAIQMNFLEERIREEVRYYTHGGFLNAFMLGSGVFASLGSFRQQVSPLLEGWSWVRKMMKKRKARKAQHEQPPIPEETTPKSTK